MIAPAEAVVEVTRRIKARRETVFSYLTDPVKYRLWQGQQAELDPRPGGVFRVTITGKSKAVASGTYVAVEPPERVVFTWGWEDTGTLPPGAGEVPPGSSLVEITLDESGDETIVRVKHTGLPHGAAPPFHEFGWNHSFDRLAIVAAGGDPGPDVLAEI